MARSLLIFSNVIFKMAAWWPYWIFLFLDSVGGMVFQSGSQVCFGISVSNFICMLVVVIGKLNDFQQRHFQNGRLVAILDFLVSRL